MAQILKNVSANASTGLRARGVPLRKEERIWPRHLIPQPEILIDGGTSWENWIGKEEEIVFGTRKLRRIEGAMTIGALD